MDQTEEFSSFGDEDSHDVDATTSESDSALIFYLFSLMILLVCY